MGYRAGVDTGGTFTDLVSWRDGVIRVDKVPSTPDDPARAVLDVLAADACAAATVTLSEASRSKYGKNDDAGGIHGDWRLSDRKGSARAATEGLPAVRLDEFRHGSTVATNALLEGKSARTAFVVTSGFEDLLVLGRQNRDELYSLVQEEVEPLVPCDLVLGVDERMGASGVPSLPLAERELKRLIERLRRLDVQSVAVCLLFAHVNPVHEKVIGRRLSVELPELFVTMSHEVVPACGEYERACATVFDAMVAPVMKEYLERLSVRAGAESFKIMGSRGGVVELSAIVEHPVDCVLSGPAAGVTGAAELAGRLGFDRILTFDMGGTSTDVCLVENGRPALTRSARLGRYPLGIELVDIHTIGAGGGSIARLDEAGVLRVGPESAGADPGPACFARGGLFPTVTDADLALGRLSAGVFMDGRMRLDRSRAEAALAELAGRLGKSVEETALGIVMVAETEMAGALRKISVERGHDPRDFVLVAFGGAGPLHACALARSLGLSDVLVPPCPGALCALGALVADEIRVHRRAVSLSAGPGGRHPEIGKVSAMFDDFPAPGAGWNCERFVEMRYARQSTALEVPWSDGGRIGSRFREMHRMRYGYDHGDADVELTAVVARWRRRCPDVSTSVGVSPYRSRDVAGDGYGPAASQAHHPCGERDCEGPVESCCGRKAQRAVFEDGAVDTPVFSRRELPGGAGFHGPAIILEQTSTVLVEPGFDCSVLADGSLLLRHLKRY